jgi:uncharacterized radical SAM superfamily Fe-S cluster-containing enzyme
LRPRSALSPIEINEHCNLICPPRFAGVLAGAPNKQRSLTTVKRMLDTCSRAKSRTCVSGGKPALHLDLFVILAAVRAAKVRRVMINKGGESTCGSIR